MIVFHDHLDGGLRPSTLLEMSIKTQYGPIKNLNEKETTFLLDKSASESLEDFLSTFIHTISVMQSYENLERIAFEAAEDMHSNGIRYYESRFAPMYSVNNELSASEVINAINSGFKEAQDKFGIKSGIIVCGMRNDIDDVRKVAELCATDFKDKIIGFDIAGPELNYPASLYRNEFLSLKNKGINITIHAGEGAGPEYIQDAIDTGAERIGHGVRIIEDIKIMNEKYILGNTAKHVLENNILLEICVSSNIHTKMYKSFTEHPIKILSDIGFNISVNTDNRLMSNTSMKKELEIANKLGITKNINDSLTSYSFLEI